MTERRLRSADGLLLPAVTETLDELTGAGPQDAAVKRLARRYAAAIDDAALIAAGLEALRGEDPETIAVLAAKVQAQEVLLKLGPKLLDALEALGATPRARSRVAKGGASGPVGKLAALRSARPAAG